MEEEKSIAEVGVKVSLSDEMFVKAYDALCSADDGLECAKERILALKNEDFDPCGADQLLASVVSLQSSITGIITSMTNGITSAFNIIGNENIVDGKLVLPEGSETYSAMGIILKKYTILKSEMDKIAIDLDITSLEISNGVLKWLAEGRGNSIGGGAAGEVSQAYATAASVVNSVFGVIQAIITMIGTSLISVSVGSGSTLLGPTPKSFVKQDIILPPEEISLGISTTNVIPSTVDDALVNAQTSIIMSNGTLRAASIASKASKAASSVTGKNDMVSNFKMPETVIPDSVRNFDPTVIQKMVNDVLGALTFSDPLPRYEKLKITNLRFLTYLVRGFLPKAKLSFGIPGFP